MDVTGRGTKTYIKVDSLDPSDPNQGPPGDDTLERNAVELTQMDPPPPYEAPQGKLNVVVVSQDEPDTVDVEDEGCEGRCRWLRLIVLLGSIAIGISTIVVDWLWVNDMFNLYPALVFGPTSLAVRVTLCVVAALGTLTFLWESLDKTKKYLTGIEWFDEEMEDLWSLFLEEVPQITLNMLLAMCREVATSHFQLVKAVIAMVSSGLRMTRAFCYLLGCRQDKPNKRQLRSIGWVILTIACVYTFTAGACVFMFMYKAPEGDLQKWTLPENILKKAHNTARYFPNAGVFFSHPTMGHCDQSLHPTKYHEGGDYKSWFQVGGIYTFIYLGLEQLQAAYAYNSTMGMFWVQSRHGEHCYRASFSDCSVNRVQGSQCPLMDDPTVIFLSFGHIAESSTLIYGDIQFNGTMSRGGTCEFLTLDDYGNLYVGQNHTGQLHYFRAEPVINTSLPITHDIEYKPRFYQYPQDMDNVTEAWKTGFQQCDMSGALSPNPNKLMPTKCIYKFGSFLPGDLTDKHS